MKNRFQRWLNFAALGLAMLFACANLMAQTSTGATQKNDPSSFAGSYEGTVKDESGEAKLVFNIVAEGGSFSGTLTTPRGVFKILKGEVSNGALVLEVERPDGNSGTIRLTQIGIGLTATFTEAGKKLAVDLRKVSADEISGEWEATADTRGQDFPFTLKLKLDGEKVTGSSLSQLGLANVSSGTWKDGKLSVRLDSSTGEIILVANLIEGKLSGDYDYAGQMQGKWVATKKK